IRPGGNVCSFWRSRRTERQQSFHCGDAPPSAHGRDYHGAGLEVAGGQSETGARTINCGAGAAAPSRARRRNRAPGKNSPATQAAAARLEGTHSRIEAPAFAHKAIAFAPRGLTEIKFRKNFARNTSG